MTTLRERVCLLSVDLALRRRKQRVRGRVRTSDVSGSTLKAARGEELLRGRTRSRKSLSQLGHVLVPSSFLIEEIR